MSVFGKDSGRADVDKQLDFLDDKLEPGKTRVRGRALPAGSDSVPDENASNTDLQRSANLQRPSGDAADDTGARRRRRNLAATAAPADKSETEFPEVPDRQTHAEQSSRTSMGRRSGRKSAGADAVQFPIKRPPKSIKSILAKQAREGSSNVPGQGASSVPDASANSANPSTSGANRSEHRQGQQHQFEDPNQSDYDDPLSDTAFDFLDDGESDEGPGSRRRQSPHRGEQFDVTRVGTGQSVPTYLPPSAAPASSPPEWRKFAMVAAVLLVSAGVVLGGFEYLGNRSDDRSAALDGVDRMSGAVAPVAGTEKDEAGSSALIADASVSISSGDLRSKSESALLQLQELLEKGDAEEASQLIVSIDPAVYGYGQPEFLQLEKSIEQQLLLPREQRGDLVSQNQAEVGAIAATRSQVQGEGNVTAESQTDVAVSVDSDVAGDIGGKSAEQAAETAALLEQARKIAEETTQLKAEAERIAAATRAAKAAALVAEQQRAEQVRLLAQEQAAAAEARKIADARAADQAKQLAEQQAAAAEARKLAEERAAAEARRLAEERAAAAEAQRLAEERAAADATRVAEQKAEIERARLVAEERAAAQAASQAAAEAKRLAEEQAAAKIVAQAAAAAEAKRLADERAVAEAKRLEETRQSEQLKQQQAQAAEQQRLENERLAELQRAEQAAQVRQRNSEAEANRQAALAAQRERLRAKAAAEQERSRELARRRQQEREAALAQAAREQAAQEQAAQAQQAEQAARAAQSEQLASNQRGSSSGATASNDVPASRPTASQITITEIEPLEQIIPAPSSAPISDEDLAVVYRKFQSLERALEEKNMEQVLTLTEKSSTKIGVFLQLFNNFESMDIRIEDISARNASSTVVGRLRIKTMTRENGERSIPSDIYRDTVISSTRQNDGDWSRISW